jgi:hypothetical protein
VPAGVLAALPDVGDPTTIPLAVAAGVLIGTRTPVCASRIASGSARSRRTGRSRSASSPPLLAPDLG